MNLKNVNNIITISIIKQNLKILGPAMQKIGLYILAHPDQALDKTVDQIAKESKSSPASVVRFCRENGFKGFHDFQINLAKDFGSSNDFPVPKIISKCDDSWTIFKKIIMGEQENLRKTMRIIDKEVFIKVVDILAKTKNITFFAVGSSYPVAYDAYWRFLKIGIFCKIQQDWGGQLMIAQNLGKSDVAFAISRSGQSKIPIKALKIAKENGAITICLTQNRKSDIVKNSDYFLITSERSNMIYDAATFSRLAHLSIIDALYSAVTVKKWDEATKNMKKMNILLDSETF